MAKPDEKMALEILSLYEAVWSCTQKMLEAAKSGDWDNLVSLEQSRSSQVEKLKQTDIGHVDDQVFLISKSQLISSIVATDEKIKLLTQTWMSELKETLNIINVDKQLKRAYPDSPEHG